ncbi:phosphatase PAP2 family protein [Mucisphaera calidilacus]|uniref:PAP2 superfamily protein n=1 Tax=Mucisphaera calidilacus TaxID=2527982 RepID=A0A518BWB8_9BACT|nr:phosphatase PAP2 family protein [Mucisphaera calidilacus]QDU71268.1 PAP2 superfamily protein [Mucisphaera calidilacus]
MRPNLNEQRHWLVSLPTPVEGRPLSARWLVIAIVTLTLILLLRIIDHAAIEAVHAWPTTARTTLSWLTEWGGSQPYLVAAAVWLLSFLIPGVTARRITTTLLAFIVIAWSLLNVDGSPRERATWIITGLLLLALGFLRDQHRWINPVILVVICVVVSGVAVNIAKPLAGHTRPRLWIEHRIDDWQPLTLGYDHGSFPSGHATTAGAVAGSIAIVFPVTRIPMLMLGTAVATTRIGTLSHYPSDTLAGLWLGWVTPGLLRHLVRRKSDQLTRSSADHA